MNKIFRTTVVMCLMMIVLSMSVGCVETPTHATVMTIELDNVGDGESSIIVQDVYDYTNTYTGIDFWGYKTYNVEVLYYIGSTKYVTTYTGINSIEVLQVYEKRI